MIKTFKIASLLGFLFLLAPLAGYAQVSSLESAKPLMRFEKYTQEQFDGESRTYEKQTAQDHALSFRMRVPKDWTEVGVASFLPEEEEILGSNKLIDPLDNRIPRELAKFYSPMRIGKLSRIEVTALNLDYDITMKNWFLNYVFQNSYTLQGMDIFSDTDAEILYVIIENRVPYIVRTRAKMNGDRIFLVSYYMPDTQWNDEKALQEKVVNSFEFLFPIPPKKLEDTTSYEYFGFVSFDYPVSWRMKDSDIHGYQGMNAILLKEAEEETIDGEMEISIMSRTEGFSIKDELDYRRNTLRKRKLKTGVVRRQPEEYKLDDHILFKSLEIYALESTGSRFLDYEYWVFIGSQDEFYYVITMITLGREADFFTWARNTEGFRTVVESIRRGNQRLSTEPVVSPIEEEF